MITVAICDDDKIYRDRLHGYCEKFFRDRNCDIRVYASGEAFVRSKFQADILLLDIEMDGMSGLEVKELLSEQKSSTWILFISNYQDMVWDAYGWRVGGFLVKPVRYEHFETKMNKLLKNIENESRTVLLKWQGTERQIRLSDVTYVETELRHVIFHITGRTRTIPDERGIGEWIGLLEEYNFVKSHNSYLVNMVHIKEIGEKDVFFKDGTAAMLSRRNKKKLSEEYKRYLVRTARLVGEKDV